MQIPPSRYIQTVIFLLPALILLAAGIFFCGGRLIYPLDDAYIHLALAKNFSTHGNWALNGDSFTSCSSAPFYTLLIAAGFFLSGIWHAWPLILNLLAGVILMWILDRETEKLGIAFRFRLLAGLLVVLLVPLPVLALSGMEHIIQILLAILFLLRASESLEHKTGQIGKLAILAFILCGFRYEGLFLIAPVVFLLGLQRRIGAAGLVLAAGLALPALYGLFSLAQGGLFLPNSVLLKGNQPGLSLSGILSWLAFGLEKFYRYPYVWLLYVFLAGSGLLRYRRTGGVSFEKNMLMILLVLAGLTLHIFFAELGGYYRYESYLIVAGIIALLPEIKILVDKAFAESPAFRRASLLLSVLLLLPFLLRSANGLLHYPQACRNIFSQQHQMAAFVREAYNDRTVALNDIGVVSFLTDARILDLVGIGTTEVLRARREGNYNKQFMEEIVEDRNVALIMVYTSWFPEMIPEAWIEAGSWTIPDNVVAGDETVHFFAPSEAGIGSLSEELKQFDNKLPEDVVRKLNFTRP